jgi:hypothetical protein
MAKKADKMKTRTSQSRETNVEPAKPTPAPHLERIGEAIKLVEIRPGLFLNVDHIVSVRALPQEEGAVYAMLQLSNGDKLNLTRAEFTAICGEQSHLPIRLPHTIVAKQLPS